MSMKKKIFCIICSKYTGEILEEVEMTATELQQYIWREYGVNFDATDPANKYADGTVSCYGDDWWNN